jgi:ribonucleoside-triphosphate reductase
MRYCAIQNVTLNMPRMAYYANGDDTKLFEYIDKNLELMAQAHVEKRAFIKKLLDLGSRGPLALLTMRRDGEDYLRFYRVTYLMGMLGLNELVQVHLGEELHESKEALKFGLKVISHMHLRTKELSKSYGMNFVLEQTPAESAAYRMAKLDMKYFPLQASPVVKGNKSLGEIYYTNSTYLNVSAPISPIDRVQLEGLFHPLIEAGALSHIWLKDARPSAGSLANFVEKVYRNTQNAQIAFSPEFTTCGDCNRTFRGLVDYCPYCREAPVSGISRIDG